MPSIKIPENRIGVLIGENGSVKKEIEEKSGAELEIDSNTGRVEIDVRDVEDPILSMKVEDVVKAIGRGFNPKKAMNILEDNIDFVLLDIRDWVGKNKNAVRRMRGRIIGRDGRTRELIEELSETYVSIKGNTVGIIGSPFEVNIARRAVEMLLEGREHATVYKYLEGKREDIKLERSGFKIDRSELEEG
ncbi:MAG: RNA-processing protein [Candidatus Thermoplasmatota archaeon]|nr:RNA-processing protein [Candidatus Thermoplasmatota archaeon]